MTADALDPKGLIREAYAIEGITVPECRSIFLDWALSLPVGTDEAVAINGLLARYGQDAPDHPMTQTLTLGLEQPRQTGRRGGRAARLGYQGS